MAEETIERLKKRDKQRRMALGKTKNCEREKER
jgi:hypothetical protein